MKKIYIIVLNFNGGRDIFECLKSIEQESRRVKKQEIRIVVVDNGSTDESLKKLKVQSKKFKISKIIENHKNLGFAAGCNVGIRYALKKGADAVLLLNQDVVIEKNFLRPLVKNPADIVGPMIKFKRKKRWIYDFGGKINWWWGRTSHVEVKSPKSPKNKFTGQVPVPSQVDYVSGCAILIKKSVFEKIGLFDEKFFLYFEDVDFCLKAKRVGFKIVVEPESIVFHKLAEGKKKSLKQHFNLIKSNFIFVNRYIPLYRKVFAYIYLLLLLIKVLINFYLGESRLCHVRCECATTVRGEFK